MNITKMFQSKSKRGLSLQFMDKFSYALKLSINFRIVLFVFIDNKKVYKIYISTQNRDYGGEHTLYTRHQSRQIIPNLLQETKKIKREVKHTHQYVRLTG